VPPGLPLIHHRFVRGANSARDTFLCETQPASKVLQPCVVVLRDRRKGRHGRPLPFARAVQRLATCVDECPAHARVDRAIGVRSPAGTPLPASACGSTASRPDVEALGAVGRPRSLATRICRPAWEDQTSVSRDLDIEAHGCHPLRRGNRYPHERRLYRRALEVRQQAQRCQQEQSSGK
jgi:hypothetical protein